MCKNFDTTLRQVSWKINQGKGLLEDVQTKLDTCQIALRDYLDETIYEVKTVYSIDEFKQYISAPPKVFTGVCEGVGTITASSPYF